jgi:hypothetical protein
MEGGEAVARDGGREDLARMPAAVGGDDSAVRVGALEFGVDLDRLRGGGRGGEKREGGEADGADAPILPWRPW